jgi:hypothetical protein
MKNSRKFFILLALLILVQCKPDTEVVPTDPVYTPVIELGKISMKKNGVFEEQTDYFCKQIEEPPHTLVIKKKNPDLISLGERLHIFDVPLQPGKYPFDALYNGPYGDNICYGSYGLSYDGDIHVGLAVTNQSFVNDYVEVVRYDSVAGTIEGRFDLHLVFLDEIDPGWDFLNIPDTIHMSEGRFHLKIE